MAEMRQGTAFQPKTTMMPNRPADILFQLIKSLEKAEKRHFKLYITRSSGKSDLKTVRLFDALDRMKEYDDKTLLKKLNGVTRPQLANLKTHLYKQIMASLRLLKTADSIDLQLTEQIDFSHILYKKGLFLQSLRILEKAKEAASSHQKFNFLAQIISLEKRIESLHITRSMIDRADRLSREANEISRHIDMVARLSNLALHLYSWYIQNGHARNEEDEEGVKKFWKENLPEMAAEQTGFYERLYLYQSYSWYAFIRQDFLQYYRYTQHWVNLFEEQPLMKRVETGHYIKGLHNLLNAHFDLRNYRLLDKTLESLEKFAGTPRVREHDNFRVQAFIYLSLARINRHTIQGSFQKGMALIQPIEEELEANRLFLDQHRELVLHYKFALLCFGAADFNRCIDYLHRIIHEPGNLRYDLQCYARLLHMLAHYELGNYVLMDSLSKAVYRYMARMQNLMPIEEAMIAFLRKAIPLEPGKIRPVLREFLEDIRHFEKNRFATRTFAYLDVISWVESKIEGKSMSQVIEGKYLLNKRK